MAETYTLADFLQGRSRSSPYTAPVSEFTTPEDMRRQRISGALGWDVGRPWEAFVERALPLALGAVRAPVAPRVAPVPQATRRFGAADRPGFHWSDVPAGRLNRLDPTRPFDPRQMRELAKGVGATAGAFGGGAGAGSYLTDTIAHGIDPSTAAWNAAARAISASNWANPPQPPSWWPQPPVEQRPPPAGPQPQPASQSSTPWVR